MWMKSIKLLKEVEFGFFAYCHINFRGLSKAKKDSSGTI